MPLQKSFSDQNHSSKSKQHQQRPLWNRNKSFQGQQNINTAPKPLQDKPPIPISSTTKNKLSAFQFEGNAVTENALKTTSKAVINVLSDDEKENDEASSEKTVKALQERTKNASKEVSKPSIPSQKLPSTPSAKLELPDLIGMGDVRREVKIVSPEERLEWDHGKDMNAGSFQGVKRIRKRARSSSPIGSSPARVSMEVGKGESVNTQVDPGSELWGRFSFNGSNAPTPQGQAIPALAHMMQSSSPQQSKEGFTPRSMAGFRRANSCGNQFPKRRKVGANERVNAFAESTTIGPSKLSVLIERVQEGLSQPRRLATVHRSSNSSEMLNKQSSSDTNNETPSHPKRQLNIKKLSRCANAVTPSKATEKAPRQEPTPKRVSSSDYGDEFDDEDLDASLLEIVESNLGKKNPCRTGKIVDTSPKLPPDRPPHRTSFTRDQAPAAQERQPTAIPGRRPPRPPSSPIEKAPVVEEKKTAIVSEQGTSKVVHDEFDDSDDDMFTADLEHIVSQFDRKTSVGKAQSPSLGRNGTAHRTAKVVVIDSDDEFGNDGLDDLDFEAAEATATQAVQQTANSLIPFTQKKQAIQRYLVTHILESEYDSPPQRIQKEKILVLQVEDSEIPKVVHLRGFWFDTPVTTKAYVHVIGIFDSSGHCIVDDNTNLLILHPDHLISATVIADSFGCTRRAVLQDRVKATNDYSAPLVYGTILHEIFQAAMLANRWDTEWLRELIEKVAIRHLEDLYVIDRPIPVAVEYLQSKMPELQSWAELFVSAMPKSEAIVKAGHGETANMCVTKLLDVEEHIWSPMYGLKGNIDATVQVTMQDGMKQRILTVPFEVKTGKNPSATHRAQTALYNLLLSDRYDVEIAYGILYYMETSETLRIPAIRHELRHMIMQRNELACFVRERHAQLPPMLQRENTCNRCYANVSCFIYHRLADDGTNETSGVTAKFDETVRHLTPKHKEFFLKWDDLLTKEEKESLKFRRELWTMLSSEREKLGRCFSNVIIEPGSAYEDQNNPKINRYRYSLIKERPSPGFSFLDSQIIVGEPIVISDEQGHFALANGYVTHIRKHRVTVAVDRRLHNARIRRPGFDAVDNQVFASIMEVAPEGSTAVEAEGKIVEEPVRYRLDKDEFSNGMATARNNIIQVMRNDQLGSHKIRGLVVDLNAPRFKLNPTSYVLKDRDSLNVDQRRAISKVMSAEDYALVLGMPGTGKTTTIAHIIRALVSQGKSVLLTSYTHTAVDNILLKLKGDSIPILRLGTISKISTEVQEFAILASTIKTSFEEIKSAWHDSPIVATTCLGINHAIFNKRHFDYCIVDEASQITLPTCIGPIQLAKTFILVGDHYQLPPLVQNEEARSGGLDISLFKLLSDSHPSSVVYLEHQYRMCEDVMALSNNLIYNGRLKCGNEEVADRSITIANIGGLKNHHFSPSTLSRSQRSICLGPSKACCWIRHLIDPDTKVSFVNTDPLLPLSREEAKGNRIVNTTEAAICVQLVESLLSVGVPPDSIGVMTHYRSQLALLKDGLRNHPDVEMHTADRFQGRDKEVVILSLVRSNDAKSIGDLLKDWRRINVAFTRAKTKLLVIGSRETLKGNGIGKDGEEEMVARFVKLMEEKKWIFDLPAVALEDHFFEDLGTQPTASARSGPAVGSSQWRPIKDFKPRDKGEDMEDVVFKFERKRKASNYGKENAIATEIGIGGGGGGFGIAEKRHPAKRMFGQKPFKQPSMGVLKDIVNEALG